MDIRLAKDRQTGHSRGFAFITWSSVADCKQVLEYLQKATPKFNVDGTVVLLDYANGLPNKQNQVDLKGIIHQNFFCGFFEGLVPSKIFEMKKY